MPLEEYKSKRDFKRTSEPVGGAGGEESVFVVQEHHATHLHYDFRLSMDGVLKSWAVPKGVPEAPNLKRLAVQTEDHPLEYGGFEGSIPQGQYGAGEVKIWDSGPYQLLERSDSKFVFELRGKRLSGPYALVRFKGREKQERNWLIMKL